jgi:hypothetical protein
MIREVLRRFTGIRLKRGCRDEIVGREEECRNIPVPETAPYLYIMLSSIIRLII